MQNKTFRLFISSTFSDLKEERNILQSEVFPEIKSFCRSYGYNFEPIDLRWGVTNEAGLDHKAMEICINEVEKIFNYPRPNFLIMLGNRYGWIPVPTEVEEKYFKKLLLKTSLEEKGILNKWYKKDENKIPSTYILQSINSVLGKGNENLWFESEESILRKLFVKHLNIFPAEMQIGKSATEQEILKGVLESAQKLNSEDNILSMVRVISNLHEINDQNFLDDNKKQLDTLKSRLKNCSRPNVQYHILKAKLVKKEEEFKPDKDYLEDYSIKVKSFLIHNIKREITRLEDNVKDLEYLAHKKFMTERSRIFIGREELLNKVDIYIKSTEQTSFVIYGESGVGKSAFIAKLIKSIEENNFTNVDLFYRFIGISEISSQAKSLLDNLTYEISQKLNKTTKLYSKDYSESIKRFINTLEDYSSKSKKQLVLVIDALDQFETKTDLEWIKNNLPKNVKIIVSTLPAEYGNYFNILKTKVPSNNMHKLEKLSLNDGKTIIKYWLKSNNKLLQPEQLKHLYKMFENNGLPLYLKIIFDQALSWRSYDENYKEFDDKTLIQAIRTYFENLVFKNHHSKILVEHTLGYISASKNGLSENEIVEVLSSDYIVMKDISNPYHKLSTNDVLDKLPAAVWSRLYYDLLKYLTYVEFDEISLINFYHRKIKECSKDYYYNINREFYHVNLLEYFWNQPLVFNETQKVNLRKLSELPHHCIESNSYSKFLELYNTEFFNLKVKLGQKEFMLDDIILVLKNLLKNNYISKSYKNELVESISMKLFTYLVEKIKDIRSDILSIEDIHAKFMFQDDVTFYNNFLEKVTNEDIVFKNISKDNISTLYITGFKVRKANLLRRDALLNEAMEIYNQIIDNGNIDNLNRLEQSTIYYDMGTIAYLSGDGDTAIKNMQKSIDAAIKANNKTSEYMSMVKLGQIKFYYYKAYDFFESILNEAFAHFWKFRFESFSARRFVRGNYALYFDLFYEKKNLVKTKEYLDKFKNDDTIVYKSINFIQSNKSLVESSKCNGYTPYEARVKILEGDYINAADMFDRYLNIYMTEDDRQTMEFIAKEYMDYLIALKKINKKEKFIKEKTYALTLPDAPLNKIFKDQIKKLEI